MTLSSNALKEVPMPDIHQPDTPHTRDDRAPHISDAPHISPAIPTEDARTIMIKTDTV
jgi:hypothetical protein